MGAQNRLLSSDVTIGFSSHQSFGQEHGPISQRCRMEVHLNLLLLESCVIF